MRKTHRAHKVAYIEARELRNDGYFITTHNINFLKTIDNNDKSPVVIIPLKHHSHIKRNQAGNHLKKHLPSH